MTVRDWDDAFCSAPVLTPPQGFGAGGLEWVVALQHVAATQGTNVLGPNNVNACSATSGESALAVFTSQSQFLWMNGQLSTLQYLSCTLQVLHAKSPQPVHADSLQLLHRLSSRVHVLTSS